MDAMSYEPGELRDDLRKRRIWRVELRVDDRTS